MNKEEILKALKTIQNVCESHQCDTCPFANYSEECMKQERAPIDWIIGTEDTRWRALGNW